MPVLMRDLPVFLGHSAEGAEHVGGGAGVVVVPVDEGVDRAAAVLVVEGEPVRDGERNGVQLSEPARVVAEHVVRMRQLVVSPSRRLYFPV